MRETLFRGKQGAQWIEGSLLIDEVGHCYIGTYLKLSKCDSVVVVGGRQQDKTRKRFLGVGLALVDAKTVGQFTGLTDKNGKKIFEGDIGRYKQTDGAKQNGNPIICTGKVIYNTKTTSYAVESKDEAGRKYFDYFPIKDFEVIGNIHDNPELLEVTDNA